MGSICVDKAIAKLGTPAEFFDELEPEKIAEQMSVMFRPRVPEIVDQTMREEQPGLWSNVPPRAKQALYARVQQHNSCPRSCTRSPTRSGCTSTSCLTPR